ncbi:uncharacterized protein DS421_20g701880 [Arachis hypogaea]|nr:uncharacterized protein DS421_20g701880 [Arachis hypogaea]
MKTKFETLTGILFRRRQQGFPAARTMITPLTKTEQDLNKRQNLGTVPASSISGGLDPFLTATIPTEAAPATQARLGMVVEPPAQPQISLSLLFGVTGRPSPQRHDGRANQTGDGRGHGAFGGDAGWRCRRQRRLHLLRARSSFSIGGYGSRSLQVAVLPLMLRKDDRRRHELLARRIGTVTGSAAALASSPLGSSLTRTRSAASWWRRQGGSRR